MGIFDIFKTKEQKGLTAEDLFKQDKEQDLKKLACTDCEVKDFCKLNKERHNKVFLCNFVKKIEDYDKDKDSILLIDDNQGVISFLEDDLNDLVDDNKLQLNNYNILKFSTQYAGFELLAALKMYNGLNIKYAIFDITLGGGVYDENKGNIILDGIDTFIAVHKYNTNLKYIFFTGNKLNPYIKKNNEIIKKFKAYTNIDIKEKLLYKTSLAPEDRKKWISEFLKQ